MKITNASADQATVTELGRRVQRARLDRNMTQVQLAEAAGVSLRTIERFESAGSAQLTSVVRILRALNLSERLDRLLPEDSPRPLEQLERHADGRRRASRSRTSSKPAKAWIWGDQK